jgi:hypothetical protein
MVWLATSSVDKVKQRGKWTSPARLLTVRPYQTASEYESSVLYWNMQWYHDCRVVHVPSVRVLTDSMFPALTCLDQCEVNKCQNHVRCRSWRFHSDVAEDSGLLECDAVLLVDGYRRFVGTHCLHRHGLRGYEEWPLDPQWWRYCVPSERREPLAQRRSVTSQNTGIQH